MPSGPARSGKLPPFEPDPRSLVGTGLEDELAPLVPREAVQYLVASLTLAEDLQLLFEQWLTLQTEAGRRRWHAYTQDGGLADRLWSRGLADAETALELGFESGPNAVYLDAAVAAAQVGSALLRAVSSPAGSTAATVNLTRVKKLARGGAQVALIKSEVLKPPRRHPTWDADQAREAADEHAHLLEGLGSLVESAASLSLTGLAELPAHGDLTLGFTARENVQRYAYFCLSSLRNLAAPGLVDDGRAG